MHLGSAALAARPFQYPRGQREWPQNRLLRFDTFFHKMCLINSWRHQKTIVRPLSGARKEGFKSFPMLLFNLLSIVYGSQTCLGYSGHLFVKRSVDMHQCMLLITHCDRTSMYSNQCTQTYLFPYLDTHK